jgi:RecA-family ATPase
VRLVQGEKSAPKGVPERPHLLTAEEFAGDSVPEVIVDGLAHRASITTLTGASKGGKTWLAVQLAACVATGGDFLGLKTRKSRVLYVSLELSAGMLRDRFHKLKDLDLPPPEIGTSST